MSMQPVWVDGVKRVEWDEATHRYHEFDENGVLVTDRPWTPEEQTLADQLAAEANTRANGRTLDQRAAAALQTNKDYLAMTSRTNAQVAAQVVALTQQNIGIIRLLTGRLDTTD